MVTTVPRPGADSMLEHVHQPLGAGKPQAHAPAWTDSCRRRSASIPAMPGPLIADAHAQKLRPHLAFQREFDLAAAGIAEALRAISDTAVAMRV